MKVMKYIKFDLPECCISVMSQYIVVMALVRLQRDFIIS